MALHRFHTTYDYNEPRDLKMTGKNIFTRPVGDNPHSDRI